MSGLKYRLEKETQNAAHAADAERHHFMFEINALEEELAARHRIFRGEEERTMVRQDLHSKEIETLEHNYHKSLDLIAHAKDQMNRELASRKQDGDRILADIRNNYEKRVATMKEDYGKGKGEQRALIEEKERELKSKPHFNNNKFYF